MLRRLIPRPFPPEIERSYQLDLAHRTFAQARNSFVAGTVMILVFIIHDFLEIQQAPYMWPSRILLVSPLLIVTWYLFRRADHAIHRLAWITSIAGLWAISCLLALSVPYIDAGASDQMAREHRYLELALSRMLEFSFVFGPMAIPLIPATVISLLSLFAFLLIGGLFRISSLLLFKIAMILAAIILFGYLNRRHFEEFARREFEEKRLAETRRTEAEALARERNRFIRDAAHNLSHPLQAIVAHAHILETSGLRRDSHAGGRREPAALLMESVRELQDSFRKLMQFSVIRDERDLPVVTPTPISPILATIETLYSPHATAKGLSFQVRGIHHGLWGITNGAILSSILINLVDNAVKYTTTGGVRLNLRAGVQRLTIHIRDSGVGIAPQVPERSVQGVAPLGERSWTGRHGDRARLCRRGHPPPPPPLAALEVRAWARHALLSRTSGNRADASAVLGTLDTTEHR